MLALHDEKSGFLVKGRAKNVKETLSKYRVLLAYLRFGAGIKGKLLDAMSAGTPSATTTIGAEGISKVNEWPGLVNDHPILFVAGAIDLYKNDTVWQPQTIRAQKVLKHFEAASYKDTLREVIEEKLKNLALVRTKNIMGQILFEDQFNAKKFMSKWIEEKNK